MKTLIAILSVLAFSSLTQAQQSNTSIPDQAEKFQWARKSSDILGKKLSSHSGQVLGTVEDFVIGGDGKIRFVIISSGGFAGIGDSKYAIPWEKISAGDRMETLVADVSESEIQKYTDGGNRSEQAATQQNQQQNAPRPRHSNGRAGG